MLVSDEMFKWLASKEQEIEHKWRKLYEWQEIWDIRDDSSDIAAKLFYCDVERIYSLYICPIRTHAGFGVVAMGHPYKRDGWFALTKDEGISKARRLWNEFLLMPVSERKEVY